MGFKDNSRLARSPPTGVSFGHLPEGLPGVSAPPGLKAGGLAGQSMEMEEQGGPAYAELFGEGLERVPPPKLMEANDLATAPRRRARCRRRWCRP